MSIQYSVRSQLPVAVRWAKTALFWFFFLIINFGIKRKLKKLLLKKKHLGEEEPLAPEYRSDNSLSIEYASPPPYISATQSQYQNSITFISILVSISASLSIFLFYFYFRSFFLISSNGNISVSVSIFLCNSVSSWSPSPKCFFFFLITFFYFLIIPKFIKKNKNKRERPKWRHFDSLNGSK